MTPEEITRRLLAAKMFQVDPMTSTAETPPQRPKSFLQVLSVARSNPLTPVDLVALCQLPIEFVLPDGSRWSLSHVSKHPYTFHLTSATSRPRLSSIWWVLRRLTHRALA